MAHTYFQNDLIIVTDEFVTTNQKRYSLKQLGPTRNLERRTKQIVAVDIVSATGSVLESILFTNRDTEALNAVNAINQALAQQTPASSPLAPAAPVPVAMPVAKERDAGEWIGIIVGGIIAAAVLFWLLSIIF